MKKSLHKSFESLSYVDFKKMATNDELSPYEKIGFPDSYRAGYEELIFNDIKQKLPNLAKKNVNILDIGPGCSELPRKIITHSVDNDQTLFLIDSPEMLNLLPSGKNIIKIEGEYPNCRSSLSPWLGTFDVIICYSVLHYIFLENSLWRFVDTSIDLLAPGGQMLIGDIPNVSKRKRFFSSDTGIEFHKKFMNTEENPVVDHLAVEHDKIDDSVITAVIMRVRNQGCDAYWLPQDKNLPMANRREDILICKP